MCSAANSSFDASSSISTEGSTFDALARIFHRNELRYGDSLRSVVHHMLKNYENYFFEWVESHLVKVKSLRMMEFVTNVVWIKARWINVASAKSMKKDFLSSSNMLNNTQYMLT